jgi:hypothetical protein
MHFTDSGVSLFSMSSSIDRLIKAINEIHLLFRSHSSGNQATQAVTLEANLITQKIRCVPVNSSHLKVLQMIEDPNITDGKRLCSNPMLVTFVSPIQSVPLIPPQR